MRTLMLVTLAMLAACSERHPETHAAQAMGWRYDSNAPHFDHLPVELQQRVQPDPSRLADSICRELAGELEFIQSNERDKAAFTCRFDEAGNAFSLDFGFLVRTPLPMPDRM